MVEMFTAEEWEKKVGKGRIAPKKMTLKEYKAMKRRKEVVRGLLKIGKSLLERVEANANTAIQPSEFKEKMVGMAKQEGRKRMRA